MPAFIRLLDVLSVLLCLDAVLVAIAGGWRFDLGRLQVSASSPFRLLLVALVLVALRHAIVRRPTVLDRLGLWIRHPLVSDAASAAAPVCLGTRLAVLLVGLLAVATFGIAQETTGVRVSANEALNLPARLEAGRYLDIAIRGYWGQSDADRHANVAFFPALPYAMRVGGALLGASTRDATDFDRRHHWRVLYAGVLLSMGAFFWALVYLHRLAIETLDAERASLVLVLLAAYPYAVVFSAPFAEAFFLLALLGAVHHLRREELGAAAGWAFVLGLTRPNAFLLALPLVAFALGLIEPRLAARVGVPAPEGRRARRSSWRAATLVGVALLPVAGTAVFSAWMLAATGRSLAWLAADEAWGRGDGVTEVLNAGRSFVADHGVLEFLRIHPLDAMSLAAALFGLTAVWPVGRRFGWGFAAIILSLIVPSLAVGGPFGVGRMSAVSFPLFLFLATVLPPSHRLPWIAAFAVLQGFCAVLLFTWRGPF